jgi:hypothetical protein
MASEPSINLIVAVTDDDWFNLLRRKPDLKEVNFWAPSDATFKALKPGELFLFKLRAPHNAIVGGGVFTHSNSLPCSLAWEAFRESNGATSAQEMRARIAKYRRVAPGDRRHARYLPAPSAVISASSWSTALSIASPRTFMKRITPLWSTT